MIRAAAATDLPKPPHPVRVAQIKDVEDEGLIQLISQLSDMQDVAITLAMVSSAATGSGHGGADHYMFQRELIPKLMRVRKVISEWQNASPAAQSAAIDALESQRAKRSATPK